MRLSILILLVFSIVGTLVGQDASTADSVAPEATVDEAPAAEEAAPETKYFYNWETNLAKGFAAAEEQDKFVFLYFAGSDWCPHCMRFERDILVRKVFRDYLDDNLIPVLIDFPRTPARVLTQSDEDRVYNRELAVQYGVTGFPTVVILGADNEELFRPTVASGSPRSYLNAIRRALR